MTPWTVAHQAPLSMEFSRPEYWRGLLFPSPGDFPDPGIEPWYPALQADSLWSEPPGKLGSINWFFSFLGSFFFFFLLLWMPGNFNRILLILYCWWQNFILSLNCIVIYSAAAAKLLQSSPTLCDPIGGSPPGSSIPGILQARTLKWVAIAFSNAWKWKVKVKSLSRVWLFATPWPTAHQAPPSMGFSRQEYWSGVPLPSPVVYSEAHQTSCSQQNHFMLCFQILSGQIIKRREWEHSQSKTE